MMNNNIDWKFKAESLLHDIIPKQIQPKSINEEAEIRQLLSPLKDLIIQIVLTKGPITLLSCVLEIFYDHKKKILAKDEIIENIRNKIKNKNYLITFFKNPNIYYLDESKIAKINQVFKLECFEKFIYNGKKYVSLDTKKIKAILPDVKNELLEQYNLMSYKPSLSIEIEENNQISDYNYKSNINDYNNLCNNDIINCDINFKNINNNNKNNLIKNDKIVDNNKSKFNNINNYLDNNFYTYNSACNNNNNIVNEKNINKKSINNIDQNIINNKDKDVFNNNDNNIFENGNLKNYRISDNTINNLNDINNENTYNYFKNSKVLSIKQNKSNFNNINDSEKDYNIADKTDNISSNNIINNKKSKKARIKSHIKKKYKKNLKKKELQNKKKSKKLNNAFIIPFSENAENEITSFKNSNGISSFSTLSVESISFSCVKRKEEKELLDQIINYISLKNRKFILIFDDKKIKEKEEKKIRELNHQISLKNIEIKTHEYILEYWENSNFNSIEEDKLNNLNYMKTLCEEIKANYKALIEELEVLYASRLIIKRKKLKTEENNDENEGIRKTFIYNFNICVKLLTKIQNSKSKYLLYLKNINEFIQKVNEIHLKISEDKTIENSENNNIFIYKEEKESIDKIEESLKTFEDILKNNIFKCLLDTPFERMLKEKNYKDETFYLK